MEAGNSYLEFSEKVESFRPVLIYYEEFNDVFTAKLFEFENANG